MTGLVCNYYDIKQTMAAVALWIIISSSAQIVNNSTDMIARNDSSIASKSKCTKLAYTGCYAAASSMRSMLENDLPSTGRDIAELCSPVRYLVYECWDTENDSIDCIPHSSTLKMQTQWLSKHVCSDGQFRREYLQHAPCVWTWAKGQTYCAKQYTNFLSHLSLTTNPLTDHDNELFKLCCAFTEFSRCASRQTAADCGNAAGAFIGRFLLKLAGDVVERECEQNSLLLSQNLCPPLTDLTVIVSYGHSTHGYRYTIDAKFFIIIIDLFAIFCYKALLA